MATGRLVCVSNNVLLPGSGSPQPASITIDLASGKIIDIIRAKVSQSSFTEDVHWIDAGDQYVLPGLVECVDVAAAKLFRSG